MAPSSPRNKWRVLEFYCGIGGMRYALDVAGISHEVVAAVDVNPIVNTIYQHNFGKCGHMQRNIESFTTEEIEKMEADMITMSPPCQPFTRLGLKKDTEDLRSSSFLHLLKIIEKLKKKPQYFILENVKGFEESQARDFLVQTLQRCGYRFQEFLLTPLHFGIPNSRLRYYMIAKWESLNFIFPLLQQVRLSLPITCDKYLWKSHCLKCQQSLESIEDVCPLNHFLEHKSSEYFDLFLVSDNILLKYWTVLDIVHKDSHKSCCFTKSYGRYAAGTGSVLNSLNELQASEIFEKVTKTSGDHKQLNLLKSLKLRYFSPKEIANIMCFPEQFDFPEHLTSKQLYQCLGNSINIFVVSCIIDLLLQE